MKIKNSCAKYAKLFSVLLLAFAGKAAMAALSPKGAAPTDAKNNYYVCKDLPCTQFNGQLKLNFKISFNPSENKKSRSRSVFFQNGSILQTRPEKGEYVEVKGDFSTNKLNVVEMFLPEAQKSFNALKPQILPYDASGKVKSDMTLESAQEHLGDHISIHQNYNVNTCNGSECFVQEIDTGTNHPQKSH